MKVSFIKKINILLVAGLLTGCSSVHKGSNSSLITVPTIETKPLEASLVVGEKIVGKANCSNFLFFDNYPEKQTYGIDLQVSKGVDAPGECIRGAMYDAITKSKADVIVAPKYTTTGTKFFCHPFTNECLYRNGIVYVEGYKGVYSNIKEMPEDVVKERQKNVKKEKTTTGLFGGIPVFFETY